MTIATVSGPEKAALARAAGADLVVNYRTGDPAAAIRDRAPDGVDVIVELAPGANAQLDQAVLARAGTIAVYATEQSGSLELPVFPLMANNTRYQFVLVYTVPSAAKSQAVLDVSAAVAAGALRVGEEAGLPVHRFGLADTAAAQDAVEGGIVGKVLVDIA